MKKLILITFVMLMVSCKATKLNEANPVISEGQAPVLIYKTRVDHFSHVPITLNNTGDKVSSYPAPADLLSGGELALPVKLKKDFLLDRRGIDINSVFTSWKSF